MSSTSLLDGQVAAAGHFFSLLLFFEQCITIPGCYSFRKCYGATESEEIGKLEHTPADFEEFDVKRK
jgi:hypothetical protein